MIRRRISDLGLAALLPAIATLATLIPAAQGSTTPEQVVQLGAALTPSLSMDSGFFPPDQLPLNHIPTSLNRAVTASLRLQLSGGHCSASMVSPDGYVITAGHCMESCLKQAGQFKVESSKNPNYSIKEPSLQAPVNLKCSGMSLPALGASNPQVVYIGRGFASFDDPKILEIPDAVFKRMLNAEDDFGVLKFDLKTQATCIPVSFKPLLPGDATWVVGFPGNNTRPDGFGSNGRSEYVSYGNVEKDLSKNDYYLRNHFTGKQMDRLESFYGKSNQVISTTDHFPGNSGSMTINSQGELVAVHVAGAVPDSTEASDRFIDASAIGTRFISIYAEMKTALGRAKMDQIFSCQ